MKNAINYYYNLVTYDIHRIGNRYRFTVDSSTYLLVLYEGNLDEVEEIYTLDYFLLQMNIYVHEIILNKTGSIITYINQEPYILMRLIISENHKIDLYDILPFNYILAYNYFPKLNKNNWRNFWIRKVDYFEYQLNELGAKYLNVRTSFAYFIGMTETAILLMYEFEPKSNLVIAHKRVTSDSSLLDLYNPLNLVVDFKVRDICEYFKDGFFKDRIFLTDIINYLRDANLNEDELYLFFTRMLFPSFYFDLFEDIIDGTIEEEKILNITSKIEDYQSLLKDLYIYLKPLAKLPDIEWIIKT